MANTTKKGIVTKADMDAMTRVRIVEKSQGLSVNADGDAFVDVAGVWLDPVEALRQLHPEAYQAERDALAKEIIFTTGGVVEGYNDAKLTELQQDFMDNHSWRTEAFNLATSEYSNSKATGHWSDFVGRETVAALKGLEKKGLIELETFWRGATVKIKYPVSNEA